MGTKITMEIEIAKSPSRARSGLLPLTSPIGPMSMAQMSMALGAGIILTGTFLVTAAGKKTAMGVKPMAIG
jgi:hypothetical protein